MYLPGSYRVKRAYRRAIEEKNLSHSGYNAAERASIASALHCDDNETDLLGYRVAYLDSGPFRYALREIFVNMEYSFEASTDCPAILDCGANIGLATLFFKRHYPKARIMCFEADPRTAAVLLKNVERNKLGDVEVHNIMLGTSEGERSFYVGGEEGSLLGSMSPGRDTNAREIKVNAGRLSHYVTGPIDLLKLDVEGAESEVLEDLRSSGKMAQISRMIIEYHHKIDGRKSSMSGFLKLLEDEGFEYQISAGCEPITVQNRFQDVLIGVYR